MLPSLAPGESQSFSEPYSSLRPADDFWRGGPGFNAFVFDAPERWFERQRLHRHGVHSLKSYTANKANEQLGRQGSFWQDESYDHWVRDIDELERIVNYIRANAVRAGLCDSPRGFHRRSADTSRMARNARLSLSATAALTTTDGSAQLGCSRHCANLRACRDDFA
jgi:hypothetical protein